MSKDYSPKFDVIGIGNALVDVVFKVDDASYADITRAIPMDRGAFQLIAADTAKKLHAHAKKKLVNQDDHIQTSGGSVANSLVCLSSFGSKTAMVGNITRDTLGRFFVKSLKDSGVKFLSKPKMSGDTGHCLILTTPDGERTMNTHLGVSPVLSTDDIDEEKIESAAITFLEGYQFDRPSNKQALHKAACIAIAADRHVAFSLSSEFCVKAHHRDIHDFTGQYVDITFANEKEIRALALADSFAEAVAYARESMPLAVLTRGAKGAIVVRRGNVMEIPAVKPVALVDTTGAGDSFAAGFLAGFVRGMPVEKCAHLGALAGASNVSHTGARPQEDYSRFLRLVA